MELITTQYPPFGTLITFAQFLFVSIAGLPKHVSVKPPEISGQEAYRCVANLARQGNTGRAIIAVLDRGLSREIIAKFLRGLSGFLEKSLDAKVSVCDLEGESGNDCSNADFRNEQGHNRTCGHPSQIDIKLFEPPSQHSSEGPENYDVLLVLQKYSEQKPLQPHLLKPSCLVLELEHEDLGHFIVRHPVGTKYVWNPLRYRFKPRKIPLSSYLVQVIMFLFISLLNNAAFAYQIPMSVHIVFRSGGPVVNMILGRVLRKTRCVRSGL